ncbi:hypothetical protein ACFZB9_03765 [Kitasatospora sp. NPDC008050]|uniref:hypothetical protein n=1 Tax=Kitasatospora sp. NPDC008050 TaxID=3364021 RepID=UPI0036E2A148
MTADGSQGPEGTERPAGEDDPFAYLYRPEGGEGESVPERAPGVPRTPYTRPMEVGRAQYGPPASYQPQGGYPPPYQQQRPYGPGPGQQGQGPEATTQLPNQQPRYAERSRPQPGDEAPRRRSRGPVIAVVAVVAAIAIGSGIALSGNDGKTTKDNAAPGPVTSANHTGGAPASPGGAGTSGSASVSASPSGSPSAPASVNSGSTTFLDASQAQGGTTSNTVKGAVSSDGGYLTLQQGTTASWTVNVATAGQYTFWLHYNNSGGSTVHVAIGVNGQDHAGGTNFKSWPGSNGDASRSWSYTYIYADLQAGANTFTLAPAGGPVLLDQAAVTAGNGSGGYPAAPGAASPSAS